MSAKRQQNLVNLLYVVRDNKLIGRETLAHVAAKQFQVSVRVGRQYVDDLVAYKWALNDFGNIRLTQEGLDRLKQNDTEEEALSRAEKKAKRERLQV